MATIHVVKSCCGQSSSIIELKKPIRKSHANGFREAGYVVDEKYEKIGIFYARKDKLIATASFGSNKISVRCGKAGDELIVSFSATLDEIVK